MKNSAKLVISVLGSWSAGIVGSIFSITAIPTWYQTLQKPVLNPPSWVFGPVWTTLYIFMGVAAFLVWKKGWEHKGVKGALTVFGAQLILNALWSVTFFGLHNPALAFVNIALLWVMIIWTITLFFRLTRPAAYLLLPYLLWVSFASYLNFAIWRLN